MTKLKVILVILLASFVIFTPKISNSQVTPRQMELSKIEIELLMEQLSNNYGKLTSVMSDLHQLGKTMELEDQAVCELVRHQIWIIVTGEAYIYKLLDMSSYISNYAILAYVKRQIDIVNDEIRQTHKLLQYIQQPYGFIENKALLYTLDKAQNNIRALLGLYDELIEMLQQYIQQVEGKQKRKE